MPRNTWTSPSMEPRTRPAVVRTTGARVLAARAHGEAQAPAAKPARSTRRRPSSNLGSVSRIGTSRIGSRPVLHQLRPYGRIDAVHGAQPEAMSPAVEHVQL